MDSVSVLRHEPGGASAAPDLTPPPVHQRYQQFLHALKESGFEGEMVADFATRTVLSTDNSIYQRFPQAAVFPRHEGDVRKLALLAARPEFQAVVLTARGGGTGTNGQSLTDGLVVDLSRHMNRILSIDPETRLVRVQAGVVKDQLNAALKAHGLFFAPELSTSNRATLGGMINTDASGQGSCAYGKTRDHVRALRAVVLGGHVLESTPVDEAQLQAQCAREDRIGEIYRTAARIERDHSASIAAGFPKLNRCMTGYDLAHMRGEDGRFDLNSLLCGAEGTLGLIVEATLSALPVPRHVVLVNIRYAGFMQALRDAQALMQHAPISIETVDSNVFRLAQRDNSWHGVAEFFPEEGDIPTQGINLVEFSDDDLTALLTRVEAFVAHIQSDTTVQRLGHTLAEGEAAVTRVYGMRKRAVGLLGNVSGEVRPQPFVEDTAVPPENLADYIAEFRSLLDGHGLTYGMFGHVDAGVLHVRPALDMKDPAHAALIRPISDGVVALTRKYGGLIWGEHGKGVRSEFTPQYFGDLYPLLREIKAAFDPYNQLNPGKIATPTTLSIPLLRIDEVPIRGASDRQIPKALWQEYGAGMHCNGNGACYNWDPDDAMCPSWKATRDRIHSPKGRASLVRQWLTMRAQGTDEFAPGSDFTAIEDPAPAGSTASARTLDAKQVWAGLRQAVRLRLRPRRPADFSHEVYEAMSGCLGCKSCAGQCPVRVDVPDMRSRFLQVYHSRYARPLRDYLVSGIEYLMPWAARAPRLYNALVDSRFGKAMSAGVFGMVDSPLLSSVDLAPVLARWQVRTASADAVAALSASDRARTVIVVGDVFTRYFETELLAQWIELLGRLGANIMLMPMLPNGKPMHVHGFLAQFGRVARQHTEAMKALVSAAGDGTAPALVGLDPAMTLVFRQEYRKTAGAQDCPEVMLPQEWLAQWLPTWQATPEGARALAAWRAADHVNAPPRGFKLAAHCTEKTNAPTSVSLWRRVFDAVGLPLTIVDTGCCGMSGTYGHEAQHAETSRRIYSLSWSRLVQTSDTQSLLADGYSCRSQVKRLDGVKLQHPVQALLAYLQSCDAVTAESDSVGVLARRG